jgi:hypothetical protein
VTTVARHTARKPEWYPLMYVRFLGYLMTLFYLQRLYIFEYAGKIVMEGEELGIWKQVTVDYFMSISQHSFQGENKHK